MAVKKINGYRIFLEEKLGKGAYGSVYKGQQDDTKIACAIKIIDKTSIKSDPYLKAALISEIKIMKSVRSENIVGFYDVMESSNNYYIIQQLCDEGDLQHYLKKQPNKSLSQNEAIKVLTEICNGFIVLVKEGIVHRDLKPANILISKGIMKIGDFGFAKKNKGGLKNQTAVGTPLYMSSQLLKGQPYTSKCDIWAIGFIFYQMLHGKTPWIARSQFQLVNNIAKKPLVIDNHLSNVTADFLKKCLAVEQADRISWDQLFRHEIFKGTFNSEVKNTDHLQNVFKKVLSDIRFQVNSNNIHLMKLWENLGYGKDKQLNQNQFNEFMKCLVPNLVQSQQQYFFKKMDINKDKSISLKEIQYQFQKHNIPLTSKFQDKIPFLLRRIVTVQQDLGGENVDDVTQLDKKVGDAFRKMQNILTKKGVTLYKVFQAYDNDKSGELDIKEFGKIMKRLDSSFTDQEVQSIFNIADTDHSKTIEFDELNSYYCKVNGIPQSLSLPSDYLSKKMKKGNPYYEEQISKK